MPIHFIRKLLLLLACATSAVWAQPTPQQIEETQRQFEKMMKNPQARRQMEDAMRMQNQTLQSPEMRQQIEEGAARGKAAERNSLAATPPAGLGPDGLPRRDDARIATIKRGPMTPADFNAYLKAVVAAAEQRLRPPMRTAGERLVKQVKASDSNANALERAASMCWMLGLPEVGIYLMGRAALEHPDNADTLNNYAAFLTMAGAEPQALGILLRLKTLYPNNSTVLNNLGQAWFGLGAVREAEAELKAAVKVAATHPQANLTLADMSQARGDKAGAIAALQQSARGSYAGSTLQRLRRLGVTRSADLPMPPVPVPRDPLGLEKFAWPAFCHDYADRAACARRWSDFNAEVTAARNELGARLSQVSAQANAEMSKTPAQIMAQSMKDHAHGGARLYQQPASRQLSELAAASKQKLVYPQPTALARLKELRRSIDDLGLSKKLLDIELRYENQFGEGLANPFEAKCNEERRAIEAFIPSANALAEAFLVEAVADSRHFYNEDVYLAQYVMSTRDLEIKKLQSELFFLNLLTAAQGVTGPAADGACGKSNPAAASVKRLQNFDRLHCNMVDFKVPLIGVIHDDCVSTTTKIDVSIGPLDIGGTLIQDLATGKVVSGRLELGVGKSLGLLTPVPGATWAEEQGPPAVEIKLKAGAFVDFDANGYAGAGVKASGEIDLSGIGQDGTVYGGETRAGWNASNDTYVKGALVGMVAPK